MTQTRNLYYTYIYSISFITFNKLHNKTTWCYKMYSHMSTVIFMFLANSIYCNQRVLEKLFFTRSFRKTKITWGEQRSLVLRSHDFHCSFSSVVSILWKNTFPRLCIILHLMVLIGYIVAIRKEVLTIVGYIRTDDLANWRQSIYAVGLLLLI